MSSEIVYSLFEETSSAKELHGFFGWGHGSQSSFGNGQDWYKFREISERIKYKMAAVLVNACNSASGNAEELLVSQAPNHVFGGHTTILDPSGTGWGACWVFGIKEGWDVETSEMIFWNEILKPGDQETKQ